MPTRFADRTEAGRELGQRLVGTVGPGAVVLGLPRGGVVVAAEVAAALGAELDLVAVRKLGLPAQPELAMGAIAAVGSTVETVRTEGVLLTAGVAPEVFQQVRARELEELRRREAVYRGARAPVRLRGRQVVVVDDGLATGATMRAAVAVIRPHVPARVVVAVPVGAPSACTELAALVDEVVCLRTPVRFHAVGAAYREFAPTSDDAVRRLMAGSS